MLNATKGSIQDRATKPFLKALLSDENRVVALIGRAADSKSYRLGIRVPNKVALEQPVLNATKGSIQNRVVALIGRAADSKSVGWGFESLPPCHFAVGKMIKEENAKIITLSFVACGFLTAFVVRVLFEFLAVQFGMVAMAYGQEWLRHGVPVLSGLAVFSFFQMREKTKIWAHEVVVEVRKVVWPSRQATLGMTALVCVILMISGFVLGLFDLVSSAVVDFIIN